MIKKLSTLLVLALFLSTFVGGSHADEYSDLQKQLNKKNQDLSNTLSNLEKIKLDIAALSTSIAGTKRDLDNANSQVSVVKSNLASVEQSLEKERESLNYLIDIRNKQIRELYQSPSLSVFELFLSGGDLTGFMENLTYQALVVSDAQSLITAVNSQVKELEKSHQELQTAKRDLEILVAALNSRYEQQSRSFAVASYRQASLSRGLELIKSEITQALLRKAELDEQRRSNFSGAPPVPIAPSDPGTTLYFFYGVGKYSAMGHGVGMSQYGAEGYARQGWGYQDILRKYYKGASVSDYTGNRADQGGVYDDSRWKITVAGVGQMTYEQYLAGIGEIPSSWNWNTNTYAALIASARTYALRYTGGDPNMAICATASCQVYQGGTAKAAAVAMTRNKVVKAPDGSLATTLYSAEHGGHSENNENVFQWWNGNGYSYSAYSYLRGVSDADANFSFPNMGFADWARWGWNTKYSYTIGQIREILRKQLAVKSGGVCTDRGQNSWIDQRVGTLTGLGLERGVSGRVAWVVLYGTNGTAKIPGMVFRAAFNNFPCDGSPPANSDDAMFSVNFSIGNQVK